MHFDRRFAAVLAASLIWALIVSWMFYRLVSGSGGRARAAAEKPLVVAAQALPMGVVIARGAVKVRNVPENLFPAGAFSRVEDVLDRPVVAAIQPEEPVLGARLAERGSGFGLGPLIPPGMRAIAVHVNDVVGVAGFILPGMRVDVLVTGRPHDSNDTVSRTVLQNITVLSAGQTIQSDGKSQSIIAPVVTLLVNPREAEALTLANAEGRIQLVLRNSNDHGTTATEGRQLREIYGSAPPKSPPPTVNTPQPRPARRPADPPAPAARPLPPPPDRIVVINGKVATVSEFTREGAVK